METAPAGGHLGLSSQEAAERLIQVGANEIQREKTRPAWRLFIDQFKSPLVVILIFACALSALLGEPIESIAIGVILLLNALIGFFQEYRAENAILALQEMTAPRATVIRDGNQELIAAQQVVPGDLLLLESGDIIAADGIIHQASRFQVNEAVLTGESLPISKAIRRTSVSQAEGREGQVFMGTAVTTGTARIEVIATGMKTELGRIAHLIATAQFEPTPLQVQLGRVGRSLLFLCVGVVAFVSTVGYFQGRSWLDLLIFSVSLAVAAVPEGMPAIVTVALALGVQRLAARNALVRKLPSVETLGSVSVICTDKTGTLTTGKMRVREIWGADQVAVIKTAASCCDAEIDKEDGAAGTGDPTELAILIEASERGIEKDSIESENPRVSTEPFDSERRRMSVFRKDGINYVKGAVESLFPLCDQKGESVVLAAKAAAEMSSRGLRVLAIAKGNGAGERALTLVGILGIADPPRREAMQAIKEARAAGIIPIMITGDHPQTARAIARELGLVLDGEPLDERVHARATPEDKLKLIRDWKSQGKIVAMTGDGVNDAPALREAHIGIAMGKAGTEVTRQAADLVLADDNFATIVAAVREGRSIYQNIRRAILYLLTGNFAEVAIVLGAIVLGLPLPLLAAHLLWINLVTDALPALTLVMEPVSPNIMSRPPRSPSEQILGRSEWWQICWVGILEAVVSLGLFHHLLKDHPESVARNLMFTTLVFSQIFRSFGARSNTRLLWQVGVLSNLWLLGVALVTLLLQFSLHYIPLAQKIFGLKPLSVDDIKILLPLALVPVTVVELKKIGRGLLLRRRELLKQAH